KKPIEAPTITPYLKTILTLKNSRENNYSEIRRPHHQTDTEINHQSSHHKRELASKHDHKTNNKQVRRIIVLNCIQGQCIVRGLQEYSESFRIPNVRYTQGVKSPRTPLMTDKSIHLPIT